MHHYLERKTGLLWGIYRWRGKPPKFHLVIGSTSKTNSIFELGLYGRTIWVAPDPR